MPQYAALDGSNEETAIHVIDETGAVVWRGKRASDPDVLTTTSRRYAPDLMRVGLETGQLTPWLDHTGKALGLPIVCLDARHAKAATALQRNKTDARDAATLAQLVRMGRSREARVKSYTAHAVRHLVSARTQLVGVAIDLSNQIRSTLKTVGLMAGKGAGRAFENRVTEVSEARPTIASIVEPLLAAWGAVRGQIGVLDRRLIALAKGDATCRLLMTCPGVGVIVATSFAAAIEAPEHFRHSRSVGAYLGLPPARHQSGEVDRTGGITTRRSPDENLSVRGCSQSPGTRTRRLGPQDLGACSGRAPGVQTCRRRGGTQARRGAARDVAGGDAVPAVAGRHRMRYGRPARTRAVHRDPPV